MRDEKKPTILGMRTLFLLAVAAGAMASGCAVPQIGDEPEQSEEIPVDVFVRGAEPGGMTDEWDGDDGSHIALNDDGKAFYKESGEETSGMWLVSSQSDGEMMLSDGRSFVLRFDRDSDCLFVADISAGDSATETRYSRS